MGLIVSLRLLQKLNAATSQEMDGAWDSSILVEEMTIWSLGLVLLIAAGGYLEVTRPSDNWFLITTDEDIEKIDE